MNTDQLLSIVRLAEIRSIKADIDKRYDQLMSEVTLPLVTNAPPPHALLSDPDGNSDVPVQITAQNASLQRVYQIVGQRPYPPFLSWGGSVIEDDLTGPMELAGYQLFKFLEAIFASKPSTWNKIVDSKIKLVGKERFLVMAGIHEAMEQKHLYDYTLQDIEDFLKRNALFINADMEDKVKKFLIKMAEGSRLLEIYAVSDSTVVDSHTPVVILRGWQCVQMLLANQVELIVRDRSNLATQGLHLKVKLGLDRPLLFYQKCYEAKTSQIYYTNCGGLQGSNCDVAKKTAGVSFEALYNITEVDENVTQFVGSPQYATEVGQVLETIYSDTISCEISQAPKDLAVLVELSVNTGISMTTGYYDVFHVNQVKVFLASSVVLTRRGYMTHGLVVYINHSTVANMILTFLDIVRDRYPIVSLRNVVAVYESGKMFNRGVSPIYTKTYIGKAAFNQHLVDTVLYTPWRKKETRDEDKDDEEEEEMVDVNLAAAFNVVRAVDANYKYRYDIIQSEDEVRKRMLTIKDDGKEVLMVAPFVCDLMRLITEDDSAKLEHWTADALSRKVVRQVRNMHVKKKLVASCNLLS